MSDWVHHCKNDLEDNLRICCIGTYKAVNEMVGKRKAKNKAEAYRILSEQDGKRTPRAFAEYYKRGEKLIKPEKLTQTKPKSRRKEGGRSKSKILETEVIDKKFIEVYESFYREVQLARLQKWQKTSRQAAFNLVHLILDLIEAE